MVCYIVDEVIPSDLIEDICDLQRKLESTGGQPNNLVDQLRQYLNLNEIKAINKRAERLVEGLQFPAPDTNRRYFPWPEV